jgi:hypothetical protein
MVSVLVRISMALWIRAMVSALGYQSMTPAGDEARHFLSR